MKKTIIFGLDGGNFQIINKLIRKGKIPNIKRLIDNGYSSILKSILPLTSNPTWPCFYTGKNPGKLGLFYHMEHFKDKNNIIQERITRIKTDNELWSIISKNNKKVGVFDVPTTAPPKQVNGFMVCSFYPMKDSERTYPKNFRENLGDDFIFDIENFF